MITAIEGQSGAGMLNDWGTLYTPTFEPRMSDNARRVVVLRHWVEALEEAPRNSAWYEQELMRSQSSLRHEAAHVIARGC